VVYQRSRRIAEAGLVINPTSGRNLREANLLLALAHHAGLDYAEGRDFESLKEATSTLLAQKKKILLVSGGDGTFSAVLTACLRARRLPVLAVLPGGTTNLIAWDVSRPKGQLKIFRHFLAGKPPAVKIRRALKIKSYEIYGMFCAAGMLAEGIRRYNLNRQERGLRGLKNALPVTGSLLKEVFFRGRPGLPLNTSPAAPFRLNTVMVTTLEKVFLPLKPFVSRCPYLKVGFFPEKLLPFKVSCLPEIELKSSTLAVDGEILTGQATFTVETGPEVIFYRW